VGELLERLLLVLHHLLLSDQYSKGLVQMEDGGSSQTEHVEEVPLLDREADQPFGSYSDSFRHHDEVPSTLSYDGWKAGGRHCD
jgi:hypothetical protein